MARANDAPQKTLSYAQIFWPATEEIGTVPGFGLESWPAYPGGDSDLILEPFAADENASAR